MPAAFNPLQIYLFLFLNFHENFASYFTSLLLNCFALCLCLALRLFQIFSCLAPGWIGHPVMSVIEEGGDCGRSHISAKSMLDSSHCAKNALDGDLSTYWNPGFALT